MPSHFLPFSRCGNEESTRVFVECAPPAARQGDLGLMFNSSPPGQNDRRFPNDIFICIFLNGKFCISIKISIKCVPEGAIDNPVLVQINYLNRCWPCSLTHICDTRARWEVVNANFVVKIPASVQLDITTMEFVFPRPNVNIGKCSIANRQCTEVLVSVIHDNSLCAKKWKWTM